MVLHCASLTAQNKMAALKKRTLSNIMKMKLTEEKCYRNFFLAFDNCRDETQCVGNVHNASRTHVTEFDFLKENLNSGS